MMTQFPLDVGINQIQLCQKKYICAEYTLRCASYSPARFPLASYYVPTPGLLCYQVHFFYIFVCDKVPGLSVSLLFIYLLLS